MDIVLKYADQVVVINDGKIAFNGHPAELFNGDVTSYSIEIPKLFLFAKMLQNKGIKLDLEKIRNVDDLFTQLGEHK